MPSLETLTDDARVTVRRSGPPDPDGRCVVYWMQRAQRAVDNPALDVAIEAANALGKPVVAFLGVVPFYPRANLRHYRFLVEGIPELAEGLARRRVGFVLRPFPDHHLPVFCDEVQAAMVIGDENPMREPESWRRKAVDRLRVPLWTVDADVVVPSKLLLKEQFAARTIRPRIHKLWDEYLVKPPERHARVVWKAPRGIRAVNPDKDFLSDFPIDKSVAPVDSFHGGTSEGMKRLRRFIKDRLATYDDDRNQPELAGTSELSPYLHFGQLGPRGVALAVRDAELPRSAEASREAFLEQLIVRRELSINFVRFNPRYESLASCERWAKETLREHAKDPRPVLYTEAQLEAAATGDELWNAAQRQMLAKGWMHNYLRMYWAKKILEWSPSPEEAYERAVRLNDKYFLDGRDPNGYAGIAWSIGGKHDRPWFEREVFGTIRYMSASGAEKKFDVDEYIRQNPR